MKSKKSKHKIEIRKADIQKVIKIIFIISLFAFSYYFKGIFILGFVYGLCLMTYILLFPSPRMSLYLQNLFKNNYNNFKGMQDEKGNKK